MRSSAAGVYPPRFAIACKKAVWALVQARVCVDRLMVSEMGACVSRKRKTEGPEVALKAGNWALSGNLLSQSLRRISFWFLSEMGCCEQKA